MGSTAPPQVSEDAVTASELARHFGHWQRRALQAPVYVLHHGRPQFVLASIAFMQALSSARAIPTGDDVAALLDALAEPVWICDPAGTVIAAGRAARLYFGKALQAGAPLDAILPPEPAAFLGAIVARVAAGGLPERTELPAASGRARLELAIEPAGAGVVLSGRDAGVADTRDAALARAAALTAAVAALPGHAVATIGPRGHIVMPGASLTTLTGRSAHELAAAPAIGLFAGRDQRALADALQRLFAGDPPRTIDADLLGAGGVALPVVVGLAPLRHGLMVEGVQAVIAPRGDNPSPA